MSGATILSEPPGPLNADHHHELALAAERAKSIRKAARVAAFNAWITGIIAAVSVPFALLSLVGLLVTAGLSVVAYNEFRGRKRLLEFDPSAATLLGWNQVGFMMLIVVYCVWMLVSGLTNAGPLAAEMAASPELRDALGSLDQFDDLYRLVVIALYGSVIVLSIVFQGLNALYYFTRRKHVDAYVRETPEWVVELQRATTPA